MHTHSMEDERLLDASEDDILVPDTQDSPATFSQNLIKRFGICRNSRSTDAAHTINNNGTISLIIMSTVTIILVNRLLTVQTFLKNLHEVLLSS